MGPLLSGKSRLVKWKLVGKSLPKYPLLEGCVCVFFVFFLSEEWFRGVEFLWGGVECGQIFFVGRG